MNTRDKEVLIDNGSGKPEKEKKKKKKQLCICHELWPSLRPRLMQPAAPQMGTD